MLLENNVFVGVGQFGNYVARELEKLGYKVFYINSAKEDLERIGALSLENTHLIKGAKGCMKDRNLAKEYAVDSMESIINQMNGEYANETVFNFIFSTGGGTGSGVTPTLMDVMHSMYDYKIINAIVVTPHEIDITIDSNSAFCLQEIYELQEAGVINSIHVLSNDNFTENVGKVNEIFASTLDRYNEITAEVDMIDEDHEITIKGSEGDTGEFTELLNMVGNTVMMELHHENTKESFEEALKAELEHTIYAPWIKDCDNLGFYTTKEIQGQEALDLLTNEFGIPMKTHTGITQSGTFIIATGMSWNENIEKKLLKQADALDKKRTELIQKQKEEMAKEAVEDVNLDDLKSRLNKSSNSNIQRKSRMNTHADRRTVNARKSGKQRLQEALAKYKNK